MEVNDIQEMGGGPKERAYVLNNKGEACSSRAPMEVCQVFTPLLSLKDIHLNTESSASTSFPRVANSS